MSKREIERENRRALRAIEKALPDSKIDVMNMIPYDLGAGRCWRAGTFDEVEEYRLKTIAERSESHHVANNIKSKNLRLATPGPKR